MADWCATKDSFWKETVNAVGVDASHKEVKIGSFVYNDPINPQLEWLRFVSKDFILQSNASYLGDVIIIAIPINGGNEIRHDVGVDKDNSTGSNHPSFLRDYSTGRIWFMLEESDNLEGCYSDDEGATWSSLIEFDDSAISVYSGTSKFMAAVNGYIVRRSNYPYTIMVFDETGVKVRSHTLPVDYDSLSGASPIGLLPVEEGGFLVIAQTFDAYPVSTATEIQYVFHYAEGDPSSASLSFTNDVVFTDAINETAGDIKEIDWIHAESIKSMTSGTIGVIRGSYNDSLGNQYVEAWSLLKSGGVSVKNFVVSDVNTRDFTINWRTMINPASCGIDTEYFFVCRYVKPLEWIGWHIDVYKAKTGTGKWAHDLELSALVSLTFTKVGWSDEVCIVSGNGKLYAQVSQWLEYESELITSTLIEYG